MKINTVNTAASGTLEQANLDPGSCVADFVRQYMPGQDPGSYKFLVNGRSVTTGEPLREGDTLTISRAKLQGAA